MKKTVPIFLFFLFINSFSGKAQTYYPFPENNAFWLVSWGTPSESSIYHYELTGDTLIGINNYHKLESAGNTYYSFDPYNPQFYNTGYIGAYRNDTLTKKIYYFPKDSIYESLLYDFNMVTGDTIQGFMAQLAKNKFGPTFYAIIDSVDSVLVDSNYRKRWRFQTYNSWSQIWYDGNIIEGIGNTYGLLEGLLPQMDDNGFLLCYSENGTMIYPDGIGTCALITNNDYITKNENIAVYPNPVIQGESISIMINHVENITLEVFDVLGKNYDYSYTTNSNKLTFNTSLLIEGMYLFLVSRSL